MAKIKFIVCAIALLGAIFIGWWVQGLRAERNALITALKASEAVVAEQEKNLEKMQAASQITAFAQINANNTIAAMNKELSAVRRKGVPSNESKNTNPVVVLVADQLNRLFNSAAPSG